MRATACKSFPPNPTMTLAQADKLVRIVSTKKGRLYAIERRLQIGLTEQELRDFIARNAEMIKRVAA